MKKKRLFIKPKIKVFEIQPRQLLTTSGVESTRRSYGTASEEEGTELTWE